MAKSSIENILNRLKTKESELKYPIVPVREWVNSDYYIGKDGNQKLYPYWKDLICDIFEGNKNYNTVCISGGIGCHPLTDRVSTSEGYLTYNDLIKLDEEGVKYKVLSESGIQEVDRVLIKGLVSTIKLSFDDGSRCEGTLDHRIRAIRNNQIVWVRYDELKIGDKVLKTRDCSIFPEHEEDLDFAYFLGFFIGDGNLNISTYNKNKIRVNLGRTSIGEPCEEVLYRVLDKYKSSAVSVYENKDRQYRQYTISNASLASRLSLCGYGAKNKVLPEFVYKFTLNEVCHLVAGLFDSDGSVEVDKRSNKVSLAYSCSSEALINQLHDLLANLGIYSRIGSVRLENRNGCTDQYRLRISDSLSLLKFRNIIPLMISYKKERLSLVKCSRSQNISCLQDELYKVGKPLGLVGRYQLTTKRAGIVRLNRIKKETGISSPLLDYLYNHQCYEVEVVSIANSEALCGDISVKGDHTYISDGFVNHNTGKSTVGLYILVRKLYELSCYRNIASMFGLMGASFISFLYFSLSKFQAERTGYSQFRSIVDNIPYFNDKFPRDINKNSSLTFPENVVFFHGSNTGHMIGMNVIASILDEANFFGDSSGSDVDYGSVVELHNSIVSRQSSRFMRNGVNNSLSIVISSSTFKSSYTQKLYERSLTDPTIKYARARLWDIKPKGTYSDQTFFVFAGNEKFDPFIILDTADLSAKLGISLDPSLSIKEALTFLSQEYRNLIDEVPIDFFNIYNSNIIQGLQDFSGLSVSSTGKLFQSRSVFESCITQDIPDYFTKTEFTIETNNDSESNNIQYYLNGVKFLHPECARYIHIDIGISIDSYGIACCHKYGTKVVDGVESPEYFMDFCLRIVPPPAPKKVSISRCHEFIRYMRDVLNLRIGMVSFDQFQSMASRQYLDECRIPVRYLSVDKTDQQYLHFCDCMYKGLVHFNQSFADQIQHELFNLNWFRQKRKVDHPVDTKHGGYKDVMDGVVGSVWNAFELVDNVIRTEDILNLGSYNSYVALGDGDSEFEEYLQDSNVRVVRGNPEDQFDFLKDELDLGW